MWLLFEFYLSTDIDNITLSAEYAEEQEKKAQELLEKQNTEKEDETDDSNTDKGNGAAGGNAAQARQQSGSAD